MRDLPEEFAVGFVEAHQDRFLALHFWISRLGVVRADKDLAASDCGTGVTAATEVSNPLDAFLLALLGGPIGGKVLLIRIGHVPRESAAEHAAIGPRRAAIGRARSVR